MKIERSLFLLLTGTLAAGCHVYVDQPPSSAPPPPAANQPPPPVANQPTPPVANQPTPPPASNPPGAQPPPHAPPPPRGNVELHTGAGSHGGGSPTPTPTPPPASCLDTAAVTVGDCATMKAPDATCSPFPFPQQKCTAYKTYFNPKVAASAVSCMTALSNKQVCDATNAYGCGKTALMQACPDSTVGQLCSIAATSCKSTAADCTSLLSGLNEQGREKVAQCVAQGCTAGLYSCVEGLTAAAPAAAKRVK